MKILGIETSCDETAVSVIEDGHIMLSNEVSSSMLEHVKYGGIVPEIAARSHIEYIFPAIESALKTAYCDWEDIDAIAVTDHPGLRGSLIIGTTVAQTLSMVLNKPLIPIDHVVAHVYANFIDKTPLSGYMMPKGHPKLPMLGIVVSGGHSQLMLFKAHNDYQILGRTQDDAIGEAFDKVAKMLGLPYPGGPSVSQIAKQGDPNKYRLPKAKMDKYDFSFSGLKTAVLRLAQAEAGEKFDFPSFKLAEKLSQQQKADIAASFQKTAVETIVDKAVVAFQEYQPKSVVIAGGVAANQELRSQLVARLESDLQFPDIKLCTDNGAMIATLASYL